MKIKIYFVKRRHVIRPMDQKVFFHDDPCKPADVYKIKKQFLAA